MHTVDGRSRGRNGVYSLLAMVLKMQLRKEHADKPREIVKILDEVKMVQIAKLIVPMMENPFRLETATPR